MKNINFLFIQMFKFLIVGTLAFLIDYSLMMILTNYFYVYYLISSSISFSISLIFNYLCSMTFVFKRDENISRKNEIIIFICLSCIGLLINQISMFIFVDIFYVTISFSKILSTIIVMLWNFVTRKIFLEKK